MSPKWVRELFRRRVVFIILMLIQFALIIYLLFSSSQISTAISVIMNIISLCVSLHIISKKGRSAYKLTWIFLILLLPVLGGSLYLLVHFQSSTKKLASRIEKTTEKAQAVLENSQFNCGEDNDEIPDNLQQIWYLKNYGGFPYFKDSKTKYLTPGEEKLEYMLRELEKAENYIFLEYFIIQEGIMWNSILEVLKRKASQGVKVRLIYDDLGCFFLLPKNYPQQLKRYGIECQIFNPFRPFLTVTQNNRDHRKILVIDGKVAFTGGINLADEYINAFEKHGHWKDASVMIEGKAAWSFALMHLQMWEICTGIDEDYTQYYPWTHCPCLVNSNGYVQPCCDSPMDDEEVWDHVYSQIINNAKKYVYINTPYLIIDDNMLSTLCLAAKSGVDVRIVTPHKWDKWPVHMTTRSYYKDLIKAGVKVYEYTPGFIHSKTFVSDDTTATVGTANLDFRSLYLHFECGAFMYKSEAVMEVKEDFLKTLCKCQQIQEKDCKCSIFMRMFRVILRVFAPLM